MKTLQKMQAIKPHKPNGNKGVVRGRKANNVGGLFAEQLDQFYLIMPECVYLHKHQVCEQIIRFVPRRRRFTIQVLCWCLMMVHVCVCGASFYTLEW